MERLKAHWRRYATECLAVVAVLATFAWMAEVDLTDEFVIGTGVGAVLIAFSFWFFDLRRKRNGARTFHR
jgi:hypothetical protein